MGWLVIISFMRRRRKLGYSTSIDLKSEMHCQLNSFYQQIEMDENQAYQYGKEVISANAVMADAVEGRSAFFEKRTPVWKEK